MLRCLRLERMAARTADEALLLAAADAAVALHIVPQQPECAREICRANRRAEPSRAESTQTRTGTNLKDCLS